MRLPRCILPDVTRNKDPEVIILKQRTVRRPGQQIIDKASGKGIAREGRHDRLLSDHVAKIFEKAG